MTSDPATGPLIPAQLLSELMNGGGDLPSARERWRVLLSDPSPEVRLAAEVALLAQFRAHHPDQPLPPSSHSRMPHRVPQFGFPEPKRHCLRCYGHDFWVDGQGTLHCEHCEPMPTV